MSSQAEFNRKSRPAKVGTIPMLIVIDGRCSIEVGKRIRWKEQLGDKWQTGIISNVDPLKVERY